MNQDIKQNIQQDDSKEQNQVENKTHSQQDQNTSADNHSNNLNPKSNLALFSHKSKMVFLSLAIIVLAVIWVGYLKNHRGENAKDSASDHIKDQKIIQQHNQNPNIISSKEVIKEVEKHEAEKQTSVSEQNETEKVIPPNNTAQDGFTQNENIQSSVLLSDDSASSEKEAGDKLKAQDGDLYKQENKREFLADNKQQYNQKDSNSENEDQSSDSKTIYQVKQEVIYRHYLANVSQLLFNFLQDKQITDQLNYLKSIRLPQKYESLLKVLQEYNSNYLMEQNSNIVDNNIISNWVMSNWLVSKFVKVQKLPSKEQVTLKATITNQLQDFIYFLDSEESQNIFINKVKE